MGGIKEVLLFSTFLLIVSFAFSQWTVVFFNGNQNNKDSSDVLERQIIFFWFY